MRFVIILAALSAPAIVQARADDANPPNRIRSVEVARGGACPEPVGDEVVVCHDAEEPYRIPKTLRDTAEPAAANQSWVNRTATMDEVGRVAGGLPNTCSVIGSGGQTGCTAALLRAWAAERRQMARVVESVP